MQKRGILAMLCLMGGLLPGAFASAQGEGEVAGVLSPTPVSERTCMAVRLAVPAGQALAGLRWYNNDGTLPFPQVLVEPAQPGEAPQLEGAPLTLASVAGESSGWSEIQLQEAVRSATGEVVVVFVLPAHRERTALGAGGGPGFGYWQGGGGPATYVSAEGKDWAPLHPDDGLAVEAMLVEATGATSLLASSSGSTTAVEREEPYRFETKLEGVLPNPFNPRTEVRFSLERPGRVRMAVYDLRGRRVRTLVEADLAAGEHSILWKGQDEGGQRVASGVYLLRLEALGKTFTQRIALVR